MKRNYKNSRARCAERKVHAETFEDLIPTACSGK